MASCMFQQMHEVVLRKTVGRALGLNETLPDHMSVVPLVVTHVEREACADRLRNELSSAISHLTGVALRVDVYASDLQGMATAQDLLGVLRSRWAAAASMVEPREDDTWSAF